MQNCGKGKKKPKIGLYISTACFLLFGMACGVLVGQYAYSIAGDMPFGQFLMVLGLLLLAMYVSIFLQIVIHEAGHLIFGLLSGYRFSSFRIGSWMWLVDNGKIKLRRLSLAGTGGQCLMGPPEFENGRIPFILYNLGGSLLNLASAPLFLCAYAACKDLPALPLIFLIAGMAGFLFACLNGIPMHAGTVDNDGYNILSIQKSKKSMRAFWLQMKVNEQMSGGIRIKDMPKDWFFLPQDEDMGNSMVAALAVFYENRLMDTHAFAQALPLIEKLKEMDTAVNGLHDKLLTCDFIYCILLEGADYEKIEGLLDKGQRKFMKQMRKFPSVIRTEYALSLLYEKDAAKAAFWKKEFGRCALAYPYASEIESEQELLQKADLASGG